MLCRWLHHLAMGLIQIRDVPEDVHRTLKVRAAAEGTSLSAYVLREVTRVARTPTAQELDARIAARIRAGVSTKDILEARDSGRRR
jgi:plasmid stability protein